MANQRSGRSGRSSGGRSGGGSKGARQHDGEAPSACDRYEAFCVTERKNDDKWWQRIGTAFRFTRNDGRIGYTVVLDALPIGNEIVLLEPRSDNEGG